MLTKRPFPNPLFFRQVRNRPICNCLSMSHLQIRKFPTSGVVLKKVYQKND